jgi:Rrf2 family protein
MNTNDGCTIRLRPAYSPTCQYALRALTHLALHQGEGPVLSRNIATREGIPQKFLSKILHDLRIKGIVHSRRGPGGGFTLARPPMQITVGEVVSLMDGIPDVSGRCILGLDQCRDENCCALHEAWKRFRQQYAATVEALSLHDLAVSLQERRADDQAQIAMGDTRARA